MSLVFNGASLFLQHIHRIVLFYYWTYLLMKSISESVRSIRRRSICLIIYSYLFLSPKRITREYCFLVNLGGCVNIDDNPLELYSENCFPYFSYGFFVSFFLSIMIQLLLNYSYSLWKNSILVLNWLTHEEYQWVSDIN